MGPLGPLKKSLRSRPKGPLGPLGPLKKSLRSGPKGPLGPLGPLKSRFAAGSMPGIHQNGRLHLLFHARKSKKWAASPPILVGSGHEIKAVANHFGEFRAWIPERSDFFKGPKGPKGPLGPLLTVFPQNKTKQNTARMSPDLLPVLTTVPPCFVLFCFAGSRKRPPGGPYFKGPKRAPINLAPGPLILRGPNGPQ